MISFEFPITERSRILLRLEHLFSRFFTFSERESACDHHIALSLLFEILEAASRSEIKSDFIQEFERQKRLLSQSTSDIDYGIDNLLGEIEQACSGLFAVTHKFGQHLRENEWLMVIKQKMAIPGGACSHDIPSYYLWLQKSAELRRQDLHHWAEPMMPTYQAVRLLLKILRAESKSHTLMARGGSFQQMASGKTPQILKVTYDQALNVTPECSANKYTVNVRFVQQAMTGGRNKQTSQDIPFQLSSYYF